MAQPSGCATKSIDCLTQAVIKRICDYLETSDLVNACSVIPHWDAILKLPASKPLLEDYVMNIKWLDPMLLRLFRPMNELDICIDSRLAIQHHDAEEKAMRARFLSSRLPTTNRRPVELQIFYCDDTNRGYFQTQREQVLDFLQLSGFTIVNSNEVDLVIVVIFGRYAQRIDLAYMSQSVKREQALLILHITDPSNDKVSNVEWIRESTGRYYCYLFRLPTKKWRVWHIEMRKDEPLDLTDALNWAYCTILTPPHKL
nr:hypothetical protein HmN_000848100 [Hymenolepis microstoma]